MSAVGTHGGNRFLRASLVNQGSITVTQSLTMDQASAAHTNGGTITLAGANLTVSQSGTTPSFTTSGTLNTGPGDTVAVTGGVFSYPTGTLGGVGSLLLSNGTANLSIPVVNDTLAFVFTNETVNGPGLVTNQLGRTMTLQGVTMNAPFDNEGTLVTLGSNSFTGGLTTGSGSLLRIAGSAFGTGQVTMSNGFTNVGGLELTDIDPSFARDALLTVTNGTLVNATGGSIKSLPGTFGGNRFMRANLSNQGQVLVSQTLTLDRASTTYSNTSTGTITLATGDLLLTQSGVSPSFTTNGFVTIGAGRTFNVTGGAFNYGGPINGLGGFGTALFVSSTIALTPDLTNDTLTVVFANSIVNGPGKLINLRTRTLTLQTVTVNAPLDNHGLLRATGTVNANGALTTDTSSTINVEGTSAAGTGQLSVTASFANGGAITLTNSDPTFARDAILVIPDTATLANSPGATISSLFGTKGGNRFLTANVTNSGTVSVAQALTMNQVNTRVGNSGLVKLAGGDLTVTLSGFRPALNNTGTIDVGTNKLTVNGTGGFTNQSTGIFMGSGTFDVSAPNLSFITDGKTIVGASPGIGTLTFKGYYLMGPTGSVDVEVGTPTTGAFDQLLADSVNLQGGTLNVQIGTVGGQTYPIILVPLGNSLLGDFQTKNIDPVPKCALGPSGSAYVIVCP